ncbi:MAG: hypothetical protein FVQ83_04150 [Chloroflexi bacterium]|nr:hypothetical protein [Chloroflexota bacterium]
MRKISKETLQKVILLYFVGKFREGVFTNYRFQKVLYFALKDLEENPFRYQHTTYGQYSFDAKVILELLNELGFVSSSELPNVGDAGEMWAVFDKDAVEHYRKILLSYSQELVNAIDTSIKEIGYLSSRELVTLAHDDPGLQSTPFGDTILEETLLEKVKVDLSEDECEDLDLIFNLGFNRGMEKLIAGIAETDFDLGRVEKTASIL